MTILTSLINLIILATLLAFEPIFVPFPVLANLAADYALVAPELVTPIIAFIAQLISVIKESVDIKSNQK